MSFVGKAIGNIVGGITGASAQAKAAQNAAATQAAAADKGIAATNEQLAQVAALMKPFVSQGQSAFGAQGNLIGLNGNDAQQSAIDQLQNGAMFQSLSGQGQNAILQNAAATGGLRGGNTQRGLDDFNSNLLNSLIQQQFGNLGSMAGLGQASAAGQAAASQNAGSQIAQLLEQQGAATAGGQVAAGNLARTGFGDLNKLIAAGPGMISNIGSIASSIGKLF